MLITALAADTLLAWMPLWASAALSGLLTIFLLSAAILRARQSPDFAGMTLAMILMLWRGEAWKTVFLQSEQQVLELQQRQRPLALSTIKCPTQDQSFAYAAASAERRSISRRKNSTRDWVLLPFEYGF